MTRKSRAALLLAGLTVSASLASPALAHHVTAAGPSNRAGPIMTIAPDVIGKGKIMFGLDLTVEDYDAFSDMQLLHFGEEGDEGVHTLDTAYVASANIEYGLLDRLSVSVALPYILRTNIREADHHEGNGGSHPAHGAIEELGNARGIGDLQLGAKFALLDRKSDGVGVSLLAGLSIPTGATHEGPQGEHGIETEFQPGSGSWDPSAGITIGKSFGPLSIDASATYTLRTEGSRDTNLGDQFAFGGAVSWRLGKGPHVHDDGTFERHQALDLIVEVNGKWEERQRIGEERDPNSGGTQIFVSPGVRYVSANGWSLYSSVAIPVHHDLNGIQNETDVRFKLGVGLAI